MTTKKFKSFMNSKGYKVSVDFKSHKIVVRQSPSHLCGGYYPIFPPSVIIQGTYITYSSKTPITDGIKHACEEYADTPLNEKISKRNSATIRLLMQIKRQASTNADGYIGFINAHKGIKLESLFSIIDSDIKDLRS